MTSENNKKSFPYICDFCGKFVQNLTEYWIECGTKGYVREVRSDNYEREHIDHSIPDKNLSEEDIKKCLTYSVVIIVSAFFLSLLGLIYPFPTTIGIHMVLLAMIWMPIGIISLIFYFINPEISYGMLMSRKKVKQIGTRYIKIGRRILLIIMLVGLIATTLVLIRIINVFLSYS